MNDITYAVSVDVNNPIIPYNVYVASVLDSNVRYLEMTLYENGNIIALSNEATATASLVTDDVLIDDSVECTISNNIITVPLEDLQRHGNLDVQVTVTEGTKVLAIPFPIQVRVTPNIAEDAQIDENSLGSYAEVVHEIAEARGTYTTLHDAIAAKLSAAPGSIDETNLSFAPVKYVGSNDLDECINSGVLYRVHDGSAYQLVICSLGTYAKTQYMFTQRGTVKSRTMIGENAWGGWKDIATEDNLSALTTQINSALATKEEKSNKKTTLTGNENSDEFYPTTKAVADFVLPIKNGVSVYKRLDVIKSIGLTSINDLEVKSEYYYATTLSLAVHEGEKYRVTCGARGGAFPALFYALNGAAVTSTIRDENLVDEIVTVPAGVDTLYLNGSGVYQPAILNFNADVDRTIMNVVNAEYGEAVYSEISPEINNGYKSYQANADRTPSITHQSDSGYHFVELDVEPNEQYEIIAAPIANSDLYGLYDKTNYILSSSNGTAPDTFVTIPSNAYKLIVNAYGDIIIKKRGYRIANIADGAVTTAKIADDLAAVINAKEVKSNKKTTLTGNESSNDFYPTTKAVADVVLPIKNGVSVYKRLDLIKNIGLTSINDLEVKSTYYYATTLSLSVHEGEKYRVTCGERDGAFPALFYASDGVTVTSTIRNENLVDEIITVPSGVDTLYLNGSGVYQPAILNFNADVDHTIMNVVNAEYGEAVYSEISPEINNGYKSYQANADRTPSITHQSDSGYHFVELNVEPNEQYEIIAAPIANSDLYGLYDKTNYILSSSNGTAPDTFVTIPSNAYKLIVNAYGNIIIKKRGYRIANDVTNYNNNVVQNNYSSLIVNDNTINGIINSRQKYRYLWHDNFYREDNITDLGQNGDANFPMIYTYAGSQAGISNHCAVNTGSTKAFAYADMHVSDCSLEFQADLSEETYTTRGVGVVARLADASNYYYCMQRTQYIRFGKYVNGEMTELGNIYITSADRAPKKIGLKLCGNKIDVLCNGIIIRTVYDNSLPNGTNHGIVFDGNASGKMVNFGVKHEIEWQQMIDAMDNGTLPYNIQAENRGEPYNFAIQSDVVNGSRTALRFENRKPSAEEIASAANKSLLKRSEIRLTDGRQQLDEQIFSFDMMLGQEYSQLESLSEIIMQMHDTPDVGMENIGFEPAFEIYVKNGDYYIHTEWSEDKQSIIAHSYNTENTNIGSYVNDIGQWVNWKIHFKWAYNDFFEPIIEVYKNGQLVYVSKNPNVINAVQAPYFKIGIYTFNYVENPDECVSNKRVMYVDNIRAWF